VQQLQRWVRVPAGVDVCVTSCCDLCSGQVQRIWRDVVYQL
jgi:hypothetical protein